MSFNWSEFLGLAQELAGHEAQPYGEEATSRAAISRAYYAALCSARNHLRDVASLPPRYAFHGQIAVVARHVQRGLQHALYEAKFVRNLLNPARRLRPAPNG